MMKRRLAIGIILAGSAVCWGEGPTTAPSGSQIQTWITQLGDEDFSVREAAGARLQAAGEAAKGALEQAANDSDPEIRSRARELLNPPAPQLPGEAPLGMANGPALQVRTVMIGGERVKDVSMNGRTTHIEQGADGIKMTVSGYIDGQPVTQRYVAADAEALKDKYPQAYALWQQLGGASAGMVFPGNIVVNGGALIIGGAPMPVVDAGDNLAKLSDDLNRQMQQSKLTEQQKSAIRDELKQVTAAQVAAGQPVAPADHAASQDAYLKACDDLRKQLAAAGLPDPGAVLPPPASQRLGVSVGAEPTGFGVRIADVEPNSRGEKMGLQQGDLVHAVNGKFVSTTQDLRTLVMKNQKLVLSVNRNGQEITLREAAAQ